jgi:predicted kinase
MIRDILIPFALGIWGGFGLSYFIILQPLVRKYKKIKKMEYRTDENCLILLRGLPGSGKSTFAKMLSDCHYEADMYFTDSDGNYNFDPTKLKNAHQWCQEEVYNAMIDNHTSYGLDNSVIVVSNTFTQDWEMEKYYEMAKEFGYKVHSIVMENRHGGVNVHNCPEEKLEQMEKRFTLKLK